MRGVADVVREERHVLVARLAAARIQVALDLHLQRLQRQLLGGLDQEDVRQAAAQRTAAARANWVPGRSRRNRPGCRSPPDGRGCGCGAHRCGLRPTPRARSFTGSTVCGSRALRSSTASRFWPRYSFVAHGFCLGACSGTMRVARIGRPLAERAGYREWGWACGPSPSSSPRPWAELFSIGRRGRRRCRRWSRPAPRRQPARAQPAAPVHHELRAGQPILGQAGRQRIGGPGLRPRRHAVRVGNRRAVAAQGHGQQARVLWLGRGARRLRQHPHGQAAQIRQPGRSTVPARQRHAGAGTAGMPAPPLGLQPQIVQHAPDVVVAQRRAKGRHGRASCGASPPCATRQCSSPSSRLSNRAGPSTLGQRGRLAARTPRPSAPARGRTRSAPGKAAARSSRSENGSGERW